MTKKRKQVETRVVGEIPSRLNILNDILVASVFMILPLYGFFSFLSSNTGENEYRFIFQESFIFSTNKVEQLPTTKELGLPQHLLIELLVLQGIILITLLILFIPVSIVKWLLKRRSIFVAAYAAKVVQYIIYEFVKLRAIIAKDIRPYMFYTEPDVGARKNFKHFRKAIWITLVIFAASFQFAGLIYIRNKSFPKILGVSFTLLDASVAFMILSGSFWMLLVLGIDLLERFDIRVLDLGRSKLMNIGKESAKISRNGFNFLTLSFVAIAVQDFRMEDWVQVVVFLDVFFLISLWILLTYESNLVEVGNFLRNGLDQRTLSGAERFVINLEKRRFGENKLKEAEEQMRKAEHRVEAARQIGFIKLLIQSLLVTWFVIIFSILIIGLSIFSIGEPTLKQLLVIELASSFGIMVMVYAIKENISNDEFVRRELLWFPMFIVGNVIASYIYFEYDIDIIVSSFSTIIIFEFFWFVFIVMKVYPNAPGSEFWRSFKNIIFVLVMLSIMISTGLYQILLLQYLGFV